MRGHRGRRATAGVGINLIRNGTFDNSMHWILPGGWSISGGVAKKRTGGQNSIIQQIDPLIIGATYRATYTVLNFVKSSAINSRISQGGNNVSGARRRANGTYTDDLVAIAANTRFEIIGVSTNADFDNVSLVRIA